MPRSIELTPITCLIWLLDDGCKSSRRVTLYTTSFLKNEVIFLVKKLKQLDFYAKCAKVSLTEENLLTVDLITYKERYWMIFLFRNENIEKFFEYCKRGDSRLVKVIELI